MINPGVDSRRNEQEGIATREIRVANSSDCAWRYHVAGAGTKTLLVLTGSLGATAGSAGFFSKSLPAFRLIVPEYAPVSSMGECLQALDRILEQERVERIGVIGGSFGGFIAQSWAQKHPARVTHLVLSGTAAPDSSRVANHRRAIRILPFVPLFPILLLLRVLLRFLLRGAGEPGWREEYLTLIGSLTKRDLESRYRLAMDFDTNDAALQALPESSRVLILEGERDRAATPKIRGELRRVYPNARFHTFQGAGHSPMITHTAEWSDVVNRFLQS